MSARYFVDEVSLTCNSKHCSRVLPRWWSDPQPRWRPILMESIPSLPRRREPRGYLDSDHLHGRRLTFDDAADRSRQAHPSKRLLEESVRRFLQQVAVDSIVRMTGSRGAVREPGSSRKRGKAFRLSSKLRSPGTNKNAPRRVVEGHFSVNRDDRIRTCDFLVPNQAL